MTIHKAKGLEFKCVIMPYANTALTPSARKKEWRWVKTAQSFVDEGLPKYLPVETTPQLLGTEHEEEYLKYHDLFIMDNLNAIYVAFTRAVSEYIYLHEGSQTCKHRTRKLSEGDMRQCRRVRSMR